MNTPAPLEHEELAWLAFQYVAGEFSTLEAEAFEERLAIDQTAREAVAEAVALFHAVCAAEAAQPTVATTAGSRRAVASETFVWRVAIAMAAAVLLAATLNLNPFADRSQNVAAVSPALADAWSAVRSDFASDENTQSVSASAVLTEAELAAAEDDLAISTEAPSWMTAAVLSLAGKQPLDSGETAPQEN